MDYHRFRELLLQALQAIDDSYYRTTFDLGIFNQNVIPKGYYRFGDQVHRFGERILCYELYHQLRILLEQEQANQPQFFPGYLLQGELRKHQVDQLLGNLGLDPLTQNYIPDILFHVPTTGGNAFVIEVKVTPFITRKELIPDINKLIQFVDRYHYEQGIFICLNNSPDDVAGILNTERIIFDQLNRQAEDICNRIHILVAGQGERNFDHSLLAQHIIR